MEPEDSAKPQFDFLPLTVSIETLGGISTPLILRGTPLPARRSQTFSTATDNQPSVEIKVLLGERPLANKNITVGSCMLKDIPPAPKHTPQIKVSFEVDIFCNIKVEAVEEKTKNRIETTLEKKGLSLTHELIQNHLAEAEKNLEEDRARSLLASAELLVRSDQEKNLITENTQKMEKLIAEIGLTLMSVDKSSIRSKTKELENLVTNSQRASSFNGLSSIFDAYFGGKQSQRTAQQRQTSPQAFRKTVKPKTVNSPVTLGTTTPIIQSFIESIDPNLEIKRAGAWEVIESNMPDARTQASHSMREVLRQLLDKLAPTEKVIKASWYQKPKSGAPVTRAMRIRYALTGRSEIVSESTLSLITDLATAVDSMYSKLSAESHSDKKVTVTATRMYLSACEAVIGLIASQRQ